LVQDGTLTRSGHDQGSSLVPLDSHVNDHVRGPSFIQVIQDIYLRRATERRSVEVLDLIVTDDAVAFVWTLSKSIAVSLDSYLISSYINLKHWIIHHSTSSGTMGLHSKLQIPSHTEASGPAEVLSD
jgi:hypothetical protein